MKKIFYFLLLVLPLLGAKLDVNTLNYEIQKKHYKWIAEENPVSKLSELDWKFLLGARIPKKIVRKNVLYPTHKAPHPETLDWRNMNGIDYTTPIRNQGQCGSCWDFAVIGALEQDINVVGGGENKSNDLSEQALLSRVSAGCSGYDPDLALDTLEKYGVPSEECLPYYAEDTISISRECSTAVFTTRKVSSHGSIFSSVDALKTALETYGPIIVCFDVYADFMYYSGGVYRHTSGDYEGGHAVVAVGWNDADSCWICKNSWGPGWGENGYFRIGWGECNIEQYAFWLTPDTTDYPDVVYAGSSINDSTGDNDGVLNPGEDALLSVKLYNGSGWGNASNVSTVLRDTPYTNVSIADSTAWYGNILSCDTVENSTDPFPINVNFDSTGNIPLEMFVQGQGEGGENWYKSLHFIIPVSYEQYGWPQYSDAVISSPILMDMYNTGKKDVIYSTGNGYLYVKDSQGNNVAGFPTKITNVTYGSVSAYDINRDGRIEIIAAGFDSTIYAVDDSGSVMWSYKTDEPFRSTPVIEDLDKDSLYEIIIGGMKGEIFVLRDDGTLSDSFPFQSPDSAIILTGVATGDIDNDGFPDIIYGTVKGDVYAINRFGKILSGWPFKASMGFPESPSIGKFTEGVKVIIGSFNDTLYILNSDGSVYAKVGTGGDIRTSPALTDIDGDGDLEIFIGSDDKYIYGLNPDGSYVPGWPVFIGLRVQGSIVFSDIDSSGTEEVIVNGAGNVYAYSSSGQVISSFPITTAGDATPPAIDDIDNDGDMEIVEGTNKGMYAIDYKTKTIKGNYWNMFRGNSRRTGYVGEPDFGIPEKKGGIFNYSVYPNPTSGKIHLILPSNTNVKVHIYDITGRRIMVKGWNSAYNKGIFNLSKLHSGVYFMKIDSKNNSVIKKIILVK